MRDLSNRALPVGIQSFYEIREKNFLYVDKTDLIWELTHKGKKKYHYLSRPRRFGKSVLVDTLQAYFEGEKRLFEGLKIMDLETEWTRYPVIRFDMSRGGASVVELCAYLDSAFSKYEEKYGITTKEGAPLNTRFDAIITAAYEQTGQQVVILIDEYDSPLQHSWRTSEHAGCTEVYRSVFAILKADDVYERFVFITGITKFTQISLFSVLNNLSNISFEPQFAAICGITKQEVTDNFMPEIEQLGIENGWNTEETLSRLKDYYDGYHFSRRNMAEVFNPFSLVNALSDMDLKNYWAASGATSLLSKFVEDMEVRLDYFDHCYIDRDSLETSDVCDGGAELFLYQSGYLTIKDYEEGVYTLGFPNYEVRKALYKIVIPALTRMSTSDVVSAQSLLMKMMQDGKVAEAMTTLRTLISDVPYSNKKLASMDMEERYRLIISTIMKAIGFKVEVERMLATGRIDIVVFTFKYIYVIELKLSNNGGVAAAENQIMTNQYTAPFMADKRKVIALAIELDNLGKGLIDWKIV